jgi:hypothetical protein
MRSLFAPAGTFRRAAWGRFGSKQISLTAPAQNSGCFYFWDCQNLMGARKAFFLCCSTPFCLLSL